MQPRAAYARTARAERYQRYFTGREYPMVAGVATLALAQNKFRFSDRCQPIPYRCQLLACQQNPTTIQRLRQGEPAMENCDGNGG